MNITQDGYISGPGCDLEWHFDYWSSEMAEELAKQLYDADSILLGRNTFEAMESYWSMKRTDCCIPREDIVFAEMMNDHKKFVLSKHIRKTKWNNSEILKGKLKKEITTLKKTKGLDIMVYGSATLATALFQEQLIDECRLWVHPVSIGTGQQLFGGASITGRFRLLKVKDFNSGVRLHFYAVAPS